LILPQCLEAMISHKLVLFAYVQAIFWYRYSDEPLHAKLPEEDPKFIKLTEGRNTLLRNKIAKYYICTFLNCKILRNVLNNQLFLRRKHNALQLQREIIVVYSEKSRELQNRICIKCKHSRQTYFQALQITLLPHRLMFPRSDSARYTSWRTQLNKHISLTLLIILVTSSANYFSIHPLMGARGRTVGWDTALQVGKSRVQFPVVSMEFFIDIILPTALWPRGWLST
jgi:hypothetical protein